MKRSQTIAVVILVLIVSVLAGIGFDRWRTSRRQETVKVRAAEQQVATQTSPLPQWGSLLPAGENVEVSGSAMCGYCTWKAGEAPDNLVLQTSTEPGIVFVVGNAKRAEIEKITGACADGSYYVTARGAVTQYNGHNYLLVKNFDLVKTK